MAHKVEDVRNFALLGHGSSGKTALVDAIAFETKISARHGNTHDGSSVSDTEPEERDRKQTLNSHLFHFTAKGKVVRMVDTPGHPDFMADALGALRAVELAVFVIDCATGVSFNVRRLWKQAEAAAVGRMIVLTKADAENVDLDLVLETIRDKLGDKVVPLVLPDATGKAFSQVQAVLRGEGPKAADLRAVLEERVAESDDALMERYFEQGSLGDDGLQANLARAIAKGTVIPLLAAAPPSMKGIKELVEFIADFGPSPLQAAPVRAAAKPDGDPVIEITPDPAGPLCGFVFKLVSDPFVGKLSFIRVLRGQLTPEAGFAVARTGGHEKVGGLLAVQGKDTAPLASAGPGDIVAVAKIENLRLGDTVTKDGEVVYLPKVAHPSPMVAVAVEPKSRNDEQKISPSLEKLTAEDPTLHVYRDPDTSEMVVEGLSALHLDVVFARLHRRYKVEVNQHVPSVPYKETITGSSEGHHRHKKQSGGRGQFGEVYLRVRPVERGKGFNFVDGVVGGKIPRQFIPEVEKGIVNTMKKGPLAFCPVVDCEVELHDGKYHDVDSDQLSFQLAGGRAFLDAFEKAKPILLEPVMKLEVRVPSRFTGDITSNLVNQRARMTGLDSDGDDQIIHCVMPLKESRSYQSQLRSITAGEGSFTMAFSHYDTVPGNLQHEIVAQARAKVAREKEEK